LRTEVLHKIIARAIKKSDFTLQRNITFKELGADSLDIIQIMVAVEDAFGIDLDNRDLKGISDMGEFVDYIKKKMAEKK
jgi:acyl carrier protein